jgi:hypothetical protein
MSGKGELVEYRREHRSKAELQKPKAREELKTIINDLIDQATDEITIEVMSKASTAKLREELDKRGGK